VIAIFALLFACATPVDQPEEIALDRTSCDGCGMLISDPAYAAELVTVDGERHEFDDPACAFRWIAEHGPRLAHVWFADAAGDWLDWNEVAFLPAEDGPPMDGGWRAEPVGTPGGVGFGEASSAVLGGRR
jgi:copper chaperone NosL